MQVQYVLSEAEYRSITDTIRQVKLVLLSNVKALQAENDGELVLRIDKRVIDLILTHELTPDGLSIVPKTMADTKGV